MSQHAAGWIIFIAAMGMFTGLVAVDIQSLEYWESWKTPGFIGRTLFNFSTVCMAFVGGKLMPTKRNDE